MCAFSGQVRARSSPTYMGLESTRCATLCGSSAWSLGSATFPTSWLGNKSFSISLPQFSASTKRGCADDMTFLPGLCGLKEQYVWCF